jgi:hypothetical protein
MKFEWPALHLRYLVQVEAEVLVVKGDDVAETISGVVLACQIHKLFVGVSSHSNFIRYSKLVQY